MHTRRWTRRIGSALLATGLLATMVATAGPAAANESRADTRTSLTASPSTSSAGQPVTLTATVSFTKSGTRTPTGLVYFGAANRTHGRLSRQRVGHRLLARHAQVHRDARHHRPSHGQRRRRGALRRQQLLRAERRVHFRDRDGAAASGRAQLDQRHGEQWAGCAAVVRPDNRRTGDELQRVPLRDARGAGSAPRFGRDRDHLHRHVGDERLDLLLRGHRGQRRRPVASVQRAVRASTEQLRQPHARPERLALRPRSPRRTVRRRCK